MFFEIYYFKFHNILPLKWGSSNSVPYYSFGITLLSDRLGIPEKDIKVDSKLLKRFEEFVIKTREHNKYGNVQFLAAFKGYNEPSNSIEFRKAMKLDVAFTELIKNRGNLSIDQIVQKNIRRISTTIRNTRR